MTRPSGPSSASRTPDPTPSPASTAIPAPPGGAGIAVDGDGRPFGASPYRWVVLGVGAFGAGAFAALRMGLPALGPPIRAEFGLTLGQVGLLFTAVAVGVMLTLVPWGMLTDRVGERWVLGGGLAGTALALVAAAFAPSFEALLAALLAAGMVGASATGASGRAVMGWFHRRERGLALGIRQMALPLGGALASVSSPWLVDLGGIQAAFLALAGLSLSAAAAGVLLLRDPDVPPPPPSQATLDAPPPTRDPRSWRLGAGSALLVVGQSALLGFVVLFLVDARGLGTGLAAGLLAAFQLGGAAARIVAGRRSDRSGARLPLLRTIARRNAVLLALTAALAAGPSVLLLPVLALAAVSTMSWNGLAFTAAAELSGRARSGTAMGMQNTLVTVGGAVAPVAFGVLVEATSWATGFAVVALAPAAAWVVLAPLQGEEHRRLAAQPLRPARISP